MRHCEEKVPGGILKSGECILSSELTTTSEDKTPVISKMRLYNISQEMYLYCVCWSFGVSHAHLYKLVTCGICLPCISVAIPVWVLGARTGVI